VSVQANILSLLHRLRDELSIAFLFISHDLALVNCFCERIGVMYQGRIVEMGLSRDIINHPAHNYTRTLLASVYPMKCAINS